MPITSMTILHLKYGDFRACYHKTKFGDCLSFSFGDLTRKNSIVRIHSACLFGEVFSSLHCDCGQQLSKTLELIIKTGAGVIIYTYAEGRGIGIENKIKSMGVENNKKINTIEAFRLLGYKKTDYRDYRREIVALRDLGVTENIQVVSNNPQKIAALKEAGYKITKILALKIELNKYNKKELLVKKEKLGYYID